MSAVDWVLVAGSAVKAGDWISADAGGMPIYRIVSIEGGQAWLQGENAGAPRKMPLDRFLWKASDNGGGPAEA